MGKWNSNMIIEKPEFETQIQAINVFFIKTDCIIINMINGNINKNHIPIDVSILQFIQYFHFLFMFYNSFKDSLWFTNTIVMSKLPQ